MTEMEKRRRALEQVVDDRKDFLCAVRMADHLPDADLDERFLALLDEIKRRNSLDEERIAAMYEEVELLEAMA